MHARDIVRGWWFDPKDKKCYNAYPGGYRDFYNDVLQTLGPAALLHTSFRNEEVYQKAKEWR